MTPTEAGAVERLTYSAYRSMAEERLARIVREIEAAGENLAIAIVHRLGEVPAGEASVVIAAASPHRAAAYEASRGALERLKHEVPIWKREHYAGGRGGVARGGAAVEDHSPSSFISASLAWCWSQLQARVAPA